MARSKWMSFRAQQSLARAVAKAATTPSSPLPSSADAKKFGLENFGNTCYANSVLQALYFCTPFRDLLLQDVDSLQSDNSLSSPPVSKAAIAPLAPVRRKPERKPSTSGHANDASPSAPSQASPYPIPPNPATLISALRSLYLNISTSPGDKGTVAPKAFIDKLKELNDIFRSTMHQDAHEFLNYLLNKIVEEIEEEKKQAQTGVNGDDLSNSVATLGSKIPPTVLTANSSNSGTPPHDATLVHKLFEGILTSETRCLTCETVSSRDESFLDLSIDIEQNSSVTACLRQFSASEMLFQKNKFFCDSCCDLQEAEKRMKIKKLPNVLALHLKRFKYQDDVAKYIKLAYRVAFPFELRLFNTVDDIDDADRLYNLFAIVVHIGTGPHHGHYISIIKTVGTWLVFDDDNVYPISENDIPKYFGDSNSGSAYVLYYQAVDIDLVSLGLRLPESTIPLEDSPHLRPPQGSPSPIYQQPALPPGLNTISTEHLNHPSVSIPAENSLPSANTDKPSLIPDSAPPLHQNDISSHPIASTPNSPKTPTSSLSKLSSLKLRRPLSSSATRGTTPSVTSSPHGPYPERSPRPSTSTPSFAPSIEQELPPPLPPLPSSLVSASTNPISAPVPRVNEPEQEKEKSKSGGWWFGKRKSLRAIAKTRPDSSPTRSSVPALSLNSEEQSSSHQSRSAMRPSTAPRTQRHPSENDFENSGLRPYSIKRQEHDPRMNGYDQHQHTGSTSSSPSSNSLLNQPQLVTAGSTTRPSTSPTASGPQFDYPPARKSSLSPISGDRQRNNVDSKAFQSPAPTFPSLPSTPTNHLHSQNLPLLPTTPKHRPSNQSRPSNGNVYTSEPGTYLKGKSRSTEANAAGSGHSVPQPSVLPSPMISSIGGNNSSGSSQSTSSNIKRATRKLSLTAPMLGFGKRDKDRDREKEKLREREKDRTSPSGFYRI